MTRRMAALLLLRRLAAGGAVPRLQQPCAFLATAAARHDALETVGEKSRGPDKWNKNRWMELPPFAPIDAAAAARAIFRGEGGDETEGSSNSTTIRWVRRCCHQLPASLVQKLFCLRKVKKNAVNTDTSSTDANAEKFRLRSVSAKYHLVPGDTLFVPVNIQESSVTENTQEFDNRKEIEFLRSLEIYKDEAVIVVNKPPGIPVQGGVGIKCGTEGVFDDQERHYSQLHPPPFDLNSIPESLRMWMGYGSLDALDDVTDVDRTISELRSTPELLFIGDYGHQFHREREGER